MQLIDFLESALPGAVAGGLLAWIFRNWISERLKQSISHEYSTKLENLRSELGAKLEAVKHVHEVDQLRTSLFFDHQRSAFGEILAKIVEVQQEWDKVIDPEEGMEDPVPPVPRRELEALYLKHQLFLDSDLIMALELLFEIYRESWPWSDGMETHRRDVRGPYSDAEYLQPRLAAVFRLKIGVGQDDLALRQLALLGAIRMLNHFHFPDVGVPVRGELRLKKDDRAAMAINRAEENVVELLEKMHAFHRHLQAQGHFYEAEASLRRYLSVLDGASRRQASQEGVAA
ncbi:MAG: hypothetical protein K5880_11795 [Hydrogenophaga sp.]|uniref:hypothetical protein n=1 Tax=Hydrogenophaga sp. TaxID=1904254 RepID=UPI00262755DE|nr:hypothetical protein [Hydrogenophaga sp.]MCV0439308.1 hypothetical protein [Hydrogenophaga sp.]